LKKFNSTADDAACTDAKFQNKNPRLSAKSAVNFNHGRHPSMVAFTNRENLVSRRICVVEKWHRPLAYGVITFHGLEACATLKP
jgi:hypothetical protein